MQISNLDRTEDAKSLYKKMFNDERYLAAARLPEDITSMPGFIMNESYEQKTYLPWLRSPFAERSSSMNSSAPIICGIYGANDHNFNTSSLSAIQSAFTTTGASDIPLVVLPPLDIRYLSNGKTFFLALKEKCQMNLEISPTEVGH